MRWLIHGLGVLAIVGCALFILCECCYNEVFDAGWNGARYFRTGLRYSLPDYRMPGDIFADTLVVIAVKRPDCILVVDSADTVSEYGLLWQCYHGRKP